MPVILSLIPVMLRLIPVMLSLIPVILSLPKDLGNRAVRKILRQAQDDRSGKLRAGSSASSG
jgi:hypothetical protein